MIDTDRISTAMLVDALTEYPRSALVAVYDKSSGAYVTCEALPIALRRLEERERRVAELEAALRRITECVRWRPIIVEHLPAGPGVCASEVGQYGPWLGHVDHLGEQHGWVRLDPDQPIPRLPHIHRDADPVYMADIAHAALGKEGGS